MLSTPASTTVNTTVLPSSTMLSTPAITTVNTTVLPWITILSTPASTTVSTTDSITGDVQVSRQVTSQQQQQQNLTDDGLRREQGQNNYINPLMIGSAIRLS